MTLLDFDKDDLLDRIRELNPDTEYLDSQLEWGEMEPLNAVTHFSKKNTGVLLTAIGDSPYSGDVYIFFNRISLLDIAIATGGTLDVPDTITTIHGMVGYFYTQYGIRIKTEDVEDGEIDRLDAENVVVNITAVANSDSIYGTGSFTLVNGNYEITAMFDTLEIGDVPSLETDTGKESAELYSYMFDGSSEWEALSSFVKDGDTVGLDGLLTTITTDAWSFSESADLSLDGCSIAFNGLTADYPISNPDYTWVIVITLGSTNSQLAGDLIIHYSDPTDPKVDYSIEEGL